MVREVLDDGLLRETTPLPLTVSQFHLLRLITLSGLHHVGQVADFLGVSAPAATKNIDKLERLGLVARKPSLGDRRATLLEASPEGHQLVRRHAALTKARLLPILDSYPPGTAAELTTLLEQYSVSLLRLVRSTNGFCLRCAAYIEDGCPVGGVRGGCPYQRTRAAHKGASPAAPM
ncbi:MAG: MarR family transcriptional regulator [Gemmatimonadota bacterium]